MVDDLGYLQDDRVLERLPNIRELWLEGGLRFERMYDQTPLCSPSRVSMLTGKNTLDHGVVEERPAALRRQREHRRGASRRGLPHGHGRQVPQRLRRLRRAARLGPRLHPRLRDQAQLLAGRHAGRLRGPLRRRRRPPGGRPAGAPCPARPAAVGLGLGQRPARLRGRRPAVLRAARSWTATRARAPAPTRALQATVVHDPDQPHGGPRDAALEGRLAPAPGVRVAPRRGPHGRPAGGRPGGARSTGLVRLPVRQRHGLGPEGLLAEAHAAGVPRALLRGRPGRGAW